MFGPAALVLVALAAGQAAPKPTPIDPADSFGHVAAFRVRADVHVKDAKAAAALASDVEAQMRAALREHGIETTDAGPRSGTDGTADLIVDVHTVETQAGVAVSWSFHVSQLVRLPTGAPAFAATWIVGDLVFAPAASVRQRLHDSLGPALEEFCAAHLAGRDARPQRKPADAGAGLSGAPL